MSKLASLESLVDVVHAGMTVSFSGFAHSLTPMAFVRELVRRDIRDLVLLGIAEAWAADMLAGAGALRAVIFSNFMFEGYGRCPNFSRAVESGAIDVEDYSHLALASRLAAAGQGLPFAVVRSMLGSDLLGSDDGQPRVRHHVYRSPFGDDPVVLLPAAHPDVVVIHGHRGDIAGNIQVDGATSVIREQARAGATVLATVEQLVAPSVIKARPEQTLVPGSLVSAIAHVPYGAHPTGMYQLYDADYVHIDEYMTASQSIAEFRSYLERVTAGGHRRYLADLGIRRLLDLRADPHFGYRLKSSEGGSPA